MSKIVRFVLFGVFLGCATATAPDVRLRLEQLTPMSDFRFAGPVTVQYEITAINDTDAPATLVRVELRTVGPAAYELREPAMPLHLLVPAQSSESVVVTARGVAFGGRPAQRTEPATVRATAYFDGANGAFTRTVTRTLEGQ